MEVKASKEGGGVKRIAVIFKKGIYYNFVKEQDKGAIKYYEHRGQS